MNDIVGELQKISKLPPANFTAAWSDYRKKWDPDAITKVAVKNSGEIMKYAPTLQPNLPGHAYVLNLVLAARVEAEVKDKDQFADLAGSLLLDGNQQNHCCVCTPLMTRFERRVLSSHPCAFLCVNTVVYVGWT
jgi:hypothetical protein